MNGCQLGVTYSYNTQGSYGDGKKKEREEQPEMYSNVPLNSDPRDKKKNGKKIIVNKKDLKKTLHIITN